MLVTIAHQGKGIRNHQQQHKFTFGKQSATPLIPEHGQQSPSVAINQIALGAHELYIMLPIDVHVSSAHYSR